MLQRNDRPSFSRGGIVGTAKEIPPRRALDLGMAVGHHFHNGGHRVVIGKDTTRGNYSTENALTAGLLSVGLEVLLTGPIPTHGIRMLTKSMRCDLGIMVTNRNETHEVFGIWFFGPDGAPLSDKEVAKIEADLDTDLDRYLVKSSELGRAKRIDGAKERYIEHVKRTLPDAPSLEGKRVVVDCANGAGYEVAPKALEELGAEVFTLGVEPNGLNINRECGIKAPDLMRYEVWARRADIGITLNGDGSQVILSDENRKLATASQLQTAFADKEWRDDGLAIALNVLVRMKAEDKTASEILNEFRLA